MERKNSPNDKNNLYEVDKSKMYGNNYFQHPQIINFIRVIYLIINCCKF